ncbi:MAG: methylated-DNA--[protein]-cysteine S-methyltransferase [Gemmatimonadetes bacterium]|nr:methylated-DNA--[protein]-cysteine S-methyltransferase [Gemmatimonadota bacterium]
MVTSMVRPSEKAIRFLDENFRRQPELAEVAAAVGLSDYHFQRLFRRWAGVSPKRFLQFLTAEYARGLLRDSWTVLDAAYEAGLSGPGRLRDLLVSVDGLTPGEARRQGAGVTIHHGVHSSPFGDCLVAATERGVCALTFLDEAGVPSALAGVAARWPSATLVESPEATRPLAERIFAERTAGPVRLHLDGTNFQIRVWEALLRIPGGSVVTYEQIANSLGSPRAVRAVGTAVGRNPIAYAIPCHRVIRKTGAFGEYRWGAARKRAILGWEAARSAG